MPMDCSELQFYQKLLSDERISRIETILERRTRWITLALENIHHKHNLNAAIRSCEALGIQDVYIADQEEEFESCNGVHMGCDKWLTQHDFHGKDASSKCITKLKDNGYRVIALSPHNPTIEWKELQSIKKQPFSLVLNSTDWVKRFWKMLTSAWHCRCTDLVRVIIYRWPLL